VTVAALADLSPTRQSEVLAALTAVETAIEPVPKSALRALVDEALRATLTAALAEAGRVLVETEAGFISGYDDAIADRLAAEGIGVLPEDDRAVLALVLLHTVAIPRARGDLPSTDDWMGVPVARERLHDSRQISGVRIDAALRRLQDAGILRPGGRPSIVPGPQFGRLTPAASRRLFEELVLLAEPGGALADSIRRRRAVRTLAKPAAPLGEPHNAQKEEVQP
jgi:hypothetical protein